jgi:predicted exporter
MKGTGTRWPFVLIIVIAAVAMFYAGKTRLHIDADITSSLPIQDPVILDSRLVLMHHPMKDRIIIDVSHNRRDVDLLTEGARFIEKKLVRSGLFSRVGMGEYMEVFPTLVSYIVENLPVLFTGKELEHTIRPMLTRERIREAMSENYSRLLNLDGIGQSRMMSADPLGFRNVVLSRLAHLAPSRDVQFARGYMVSSDGRHVLVMAEPRGSGSNTALSRKIASLLSDTGMELNRKFRTRDVFFTLTPVGAYRAALDNEEAARKDARNAVIFATIGIALLLLVGFPRPFIGLLALAPALLGTIAAAFVYSFFSGTISILAIGFGSTIISFTVDYGISYLLFLDRPTRTYGFAASREVWSLGLLAMLTTAVSFSFLFISGFSALAQIGYFASLGVLFTYIFVHLLFPVVFPAMPPAKREGFLPLKRFVNTILGSGGKYRLHIALALFACMLLLAKPDFRVDLASMNTVSGDTLEAEGLVRRTWGDVLNKVYLMTEGGSVEQLQDEGDRLAEKFDEDMETGALSNAFVPSMIFPGKDLMKKNLNAWALFWSVDRVAALKNSVREADRIYTGCVWAFF